MDDALLTISFTSSGKDIANVQKILIEFIDKLEIITEQAPYKKFNTPAKSSNTTILNRFITFGISKSTLKQKEFTSMEVQIITVVTKKTKILVISLLHWENLMCKKGNNFLYLFLRY